MLYYDFKNYEEFKEIFGIIEHGNGVKSRKNKILLALYKDKKALKAHIRSKECRSVYEQYDAVDNRCDRITEGHNTKHLWNLRAFKHELFTKRINCSEYDRFAGMLHCSTLPTLKSYLFMILRKRALVVGDNDYLLSLMGRTFFSNTFETDDMVGLCEDGTLNAIRYKNIEKNHVFKMKAGKMFNHILSCNIITRELPEQIQRWLSEEFVAEWIEYARENMGDSEFKLHVDKNFEDIYSKERCLGYDTDYDSFHSCMQGDGQWTFYRDAVDASAAYLTNKDDMIVARCIVFNKVHENGSDKVWRLAERQYSPGNDLSYQRQLISALIRGGHIDGYKKVGASCHDSRAFVDNEGNSLEDKEFYIDCKLKSGDTLSYQDSFKWYDIDSHLADNYGEGGCDLASTDPRFQEEENHDYESWSEYHDCYIDDNEAYYVETRDDVFYYNETVEAYVWRQRYGRFDEERCFEDDCIEIGGDYYYAGPNAEVPYNYGICKCPECGDYFTCENGYYSELTDEYYYCDSCRDEAEERWHKDNGEVYSEYDGEWYAADEVIKVNYWQYRYQYGHFGYSFIETTISIEEFNSLVEAGEATEYLGKYYIDKVSFDGEPVHLHSESLAAA